MNKLSKEKRDRIVLVAIGTGGLLAALYFLVISAQNLALTESQEKTEATKQKLDKAERWLRMAPTIQVRLESRRHELEAKEDGMAPVDKFKWFYDTLDKFLVQRHVKLTDITREPEIADVGTLPKFPYQSAVFGVRLSAHFRDLGAFLADFENAFPYMRVKNLEIEPEAEVKLGVRELLRSDAESNEPAKLSVRLRVVTLIKPNTPL